VRPSGLETFVRGFFSRLNKLILQFQHFAQVSFASSTIYFLELSSGGSGCSYVGETEIFPVKVEEEERERGGMLGWV
jgi:hypothetical protein